MQFWISDYLTATIERGLVGGHSEFRILQLLLVAGIHFGNRKFCVGSED